MIHHITTITFIKVNVVTIDNHDSHYNHYNVVPCGTTTTPTRYAKGQPCHQHDEAPRNLGDAPKE